MSKVKMIKGKNLLSGLLVLVMLITSMAVTGCGKKAQIPDFTYEKREDGTVIITGLTDKGRAMSKLTIPATLEEAPVTEIGSEALKNQTVVTDLVIEEGIVTISENAFLNCIALENITFPNSLENIGTHVITNTKWEKNRLSEGNEAIVNQILISVKSELTQYTVPSEVKRIASGAFYANNTISKVTVSDGVEAIGNYAFSGCTALTEVTLPDSLKNIGYGAFSECDKLSIEVPAAVSEIGKDAFLNVEKVSYKGNAAGSPWGAKQVQ